MNSDAELTRRAQEHDDNALEQLLRRYEERIYGFLLHMIGNPHDAEDASQEAFVKVVRALPRYREQGHFRSWLFRIAYREGLRVIRRRATSRLVFLDPDVPPGKTAESAGTAPSPADLLEREEGRQAIERAIAELPRREREVVTLRLHAQLSFKEISEILRSPLNTTLGRMRSGCLRLRKKLNRM